jgi:hypothetical protein
MVVSTVIISFHDDLLHQIVQKIVNAKDYFEIVK